MLANERARRLGLAYTSRLVDGALACVLAHSGEWDEARAIAERVISATAGSTHGDAVEAHVVCGRMDLAWSFGPCIAPAAAALALAREIGEPQYFISPLGLQAHLDVIHGRTDEATELIHELLDRPISDG